MNAPLPKKTPADLIADYVHLRNKKKEEEAKFADWLATHYTNTMDDIEEQLLAHLNALKVDNFAAKGVGTAYKKKSTSVTLADVREFQRHVIGTEAWELLDWRANKTAVNELVDAGQELPPGVNYTATVTVGIRKG